MGTDNQLYDYGRFYASKAFYDPSTNRQILFGWVLEERDVDSQGGPYGWASVQSIPRNILLNLDGIRIKTPPVQEVETLRVVDSHVSVNSISLDADSVHPIANVSGAQLELQFDVTFGTEYSGNCGVYVRASPENEEFTTVGVRWARVSPGQLTVDLLIDTRMGSTNYTGSAAAGPLVQLTPSDTVSVRVFVDASVIELYVEDGASVMTRRVYPALPASIGVKAFSSGAHCTMKNFNSWNLSL
jgi:beta-fructofuranosidase